MKNLPIKDKIFWKNFLSFTLIFIAITLLFAYTRNENGESIGFVTSYTFTSIFCVLYLGIKIGQKFMRSEEITEKTEEFIKKEKINVKEFREKYKEIINIYEDK